MARARDPNRDKSFEIYKEHKGKIDLVEIASRLNLPSGTIRGWKSKDEWEQKLNGTLQLNTERSKRAKGGQPGNKNATGPPANKNSEKHGFFSKWLPEETMQIMQEIKSADPLDLLWDNVMLQYTAIIRAQKLMYVKDQKDITTTKIAESESTQGSSEKWEIQQAWDKHATFLNAQSRAMKTLEGMITRYDDLLHRNWEKATEEQRLRISKLKYEVSQLSGGNEGDTAINDFLKAVKPSDEDIKALFEDEEVNEDGEENQEE